MTIEELGRLRKPADMQKIRSVRDIEDARPIERQGVTNLTSTHSDDGPDCDCGPGCGNGGDSGDSGDSGG